MEGLGDLVYYITKYTGIQWVVHHFNKVTGFECGCQRRRKRWNKAVPFRSTAR